MEQNETPVPKLFPIISETCTNSSSERKQTRILEVAVGHLKNLSSGFNSYFPKNFPEALFRSHFVFAAATAHINFVFPRKPFMSFLFILVNPRWGLKDGWSVFFLFFSYFSIFFWFFLFVFLTPLIVRSDLNYSKAGKSKTLVCDSLWFALSHVKS